MVSAVPGRRPALPRFLHRGGGPPGPLPSGAPANPAAPDPVRHRRGAEAGLDHLQRRPGGPQFPEPGGAAGGAGGAAVLRDARRPVHPAGCDCLSPERNRHLLPALAADPLGDRSFPVEFMA